MSTEFFLDELKPSYVEGVDFSRLPTDRFLGPGTYDFRNVFCARDKSAKHVYFSLGAKSDLREYIAFYYVFVANNEAIMIDFFGDTISILSSEEPTRNNDFSRSSPDESTDAIIRNANAVLHTLKGGMRGAFVVNK